MVLQDNYHYGLVKRFAVITITDQKSVNIFNFVNEYSLYIVIKGYEYWLMTTTLALMSDHTVVYNARNIVTTPIEPNLELRMEESI